MRYFVTFGCDCISHLEFTTCYEFSRRAASTCEIGEVTEGWVPSHYEFRTARPQRLLIEPQILAISRGVWKSLFAVGSEMYRTDTLSSRFSHRDFVFRWIEMKHKRGGFPRGKMRFHNPPWSSTIEDNFSFFVYTVLLNIYIMQCRCTKLLYQYYNWLRN